MKRYLIFLLLVSTFIKLSAQDNASKTINKKKSANLIQKSLVIKNDFKPSAQDKQETIDWILEKLNKYGSTIDIQRIPQKSSLFRTINDTIFRFGNSLKANQSFSFDGESFIVKVNSDWVQNGCIHSVHGDFRPDLESEIFENEKRSRSYTYSFPVYAISSIRYNPDCLDPYGFQGGIQADCWGILEFVIHNQEIHEGVTDFEAVHKFGHTTKLLKGKSLESFDWDERIDKCNIYFVTEETLATKPWLDERLENAFNHLKKYYFNKPSKKLEKF